MLAIIIGAAGKHILAEGSSLKMMSIFQTGLDFHKFHAMLLVILGCVRWYLTDKRSQTMITSVSIFTLIGILLFSFGMYAGVMTENTALFILNPFGGISFMIAWGILMIWGFRGRTGE